MNTVGLDKRLQYYRLPATSVLAMLGSHPMGLTNAEAERRLLANGPNQISTERVVSFVPLQPALLVACGLLATSLLATFLQETTVALSVFVLAATCTVIGWWDLRSSHRDQPSYNRLLPLHARVRRNGDVRSIRTRYLAVGDLVQLETGDIVPADIRLFSEEDLIVNDADLLGGNSHTRKFAHVIAGAVQLRMRNNLVHAGTQVVRGHAEGIVIATGPQTELGRIAELDYAVQHANVITWSHFRARLLWVAAGLSALFGLIILLCWQANIEPQQTGLLVLMLCVTLLPAGLVISSFWTCWQAGQALAKRTVVASHGALPLLGKTEILLLHDAAVAPQQLVASTVLIGRSQYTVDDTGHQPEGFIREANGKPLTRVALETLALFFTTGTLTTHTSVVNHNGSPTEWQVRGDSLEGALITLARKAGLSVEQLDVDHELLRSFPFDDSRKLASSVRRFGDGSVVFVRGNPDALVNRAKKLWDHGHVRSLTAHDRDYFAAYITAELGQGRQCLALAYRTLSKACDPITIDMEVAEDNLTLLGFVGFAYASSSALTLGVHEAVPRNLHITRILTAPLIHGAVTGKQLCKLPDEAVLDLLLRGTARFAELNSEDLLRLVEVAKNAGRTVATTCLSLSDRPASQRADVALASTASSATTRQAAGVTLGEVGLATFIHLIREARTTHTRLRSLTRLGATDMLAVLLVTLISIRSVMYANVPPALGILPIVFTYLLLQIGTAITTNPMHTDHTPTPSVEHTRELVVAALITAVITCASFIGFFWRNDISAVFVDPTSTLYGQATTVALITLIACLGINRPFEYDNMRRNAISLRAAVTVIIGLVLVTAAVYIPALNAYLGTQPLEISDWLSIAALALFYGLVRLFQGHSRQHTREAVMHLHQITYGEHAPAKIQ